MTPAARATALLLGALGGLFAVAATAGWHGFGAWLRRREDRLPDRPRHLKGHAVEPRHEWLAWTVSAVSRWVRYEDGGPKAGVAFASLFLVFSVLIGAFQ